jgi:hypothetical protein
MMAKQLMINAFSKTGAIAGKKHLINWQMLT